MSFVRIRDGDFICVLTRVEIGSVHGVRPWFRMKLLNGKQVGHSVWVESKDTREQSLLYSDNTTIQILASGSSGS